MEVDPHTYEPTPAALTLVERWGADDLPGALKVIEEDWSEIWYAVDPAVIREFLEQVPRHTPTGPATRYLARMVGAPPPGHAAEPATAEGPATIDTLSERVLDLRLAGKPLEATSYFPRIEELTREMRGRLVDSSGGRYGLWSIQAGITFILAGELQAARSVLLQATNTHNPYRFPFVPRDARAKLALAHVLAGNPAEARTWIEQARAAPRVQSWVDGAIQDTIWLVDYLCAIDALDLTRAEEMRLEKPSPLDHLEFWAPALQAQVQHLAITGRHRQASALCDGVTAAGLPLPDSDGWLATALDEARYAALSPHTSPPAVEDAVTPEAVLAHRVRLLTTGQFHELTTRPSAETDPRDVSVRPRLALQLLRAQGLLHAGRQEEGRQLLAATLVEVFERGTLSTLRFLTLGTLDLLPAEATVSRAREIIDGRGVTLLESRELLTSPLTPAETHVLTMLTQGLTRRQIAEQSFVSVDTVKSHLSSAYRKLRVRNRDEAVAKATQLGL